MRVFSSLRTRLSLIFAGIVILLIFTLSYIIGQRSINEVQSEIGDSLSELAYIMGENLDQYMWSRYGEVDILSELQELRNTQDIESIEVLLNKLKERFPAFAWVGLTDKDGLVIASTDGVLRGVDISARPVYKEALQKTFIGDVHEAVLLAELLPNPTGEQMKFVDISTPLYDDNGNFTGVLATHLSWNWVKDVEESMLNTLRNRPSIEFFIVSKKKNDVILGPQDMIGRPLNTDSIELAKTQKNGWTLETWDDGKQYLTGYVLTGGYKDYPGLEWTVLVRQPVEVAYAPSQELRSFFLVSGLILVVLFAFLGWFLAGQITRPLKNISRVANRLRDGDIVKIPPYKGLTEIEILSDSLRELVVQLTDTETELEKMEDVAHRDHLTGLPNRKALDIFIEKAIHKHNALTILYLDLDGFKEVNDTFGHEVGDKLLIEVGSRLKESVRNEELVARIGGDEFVVVLTTLHDPKENGKIVGERIISTINKSFNIEGNTLSLGCSVGGAIWTDDNTSENINEVIRKADQALYKVKRTGKNRVHFEA
ncbi:diguanylate cyclase [Bacillus sp. HMF5848]|uniref:sensor domain-containing diguanylate cyclase n=1 Tax=Bacillus sp. HMF5848 TaxID=2495421 RepID=UPI000F79C395|nr:sensor domain-containing diguanylate cyclase [Bacillus sp. HMF5848]RSK25852.1 diguanylate cyclase [Bacillus sp. HMF5848]